MGITIDRGVGIPKSKILPNPWNPNKTGQREQEAIAESLSDYGQVLEVIVRPHPSKKGKYEIIDGEHRHIELQDTIYCNVIKGLTDAQAKKLTVILNETRGKADTIDLSTLLADIKVDFGDDLISGLPYSFDELEDLLSLTDVDWENLNGGGEDEKPDKDGWVTLSVKISEEALQVVNQAVELVEQATPLHDKKSIRWGQVLEYLAADYLGR